MLSSISTFSSFSLWDKTDWDVQLPGHHRHHHPHHHHHHRHHRHHRHQHHRHHRCRVRQNRLGCPSCLATSLVCLLNHTPPILLCPFFCSPTPPNFTILLLLLLLLLLLHVHHQYSSSYTTMLLLLLLHFRYLNTSTHPCILPCAPPLHFSSHRILLHCTLQNI